ncbi:neural cell adhesion molecule L1.1 isoform X1 [Tachysurus vachellii]|uniref:neural cell adhesion molecule L1.1 isoform X1 n=1 Tax=Tachysurus vachellii TaxID=175792 RepID=UPI00296AB393|nr:neural cell adhesion molecule L1.1 isoform X1 [Tachysurus vachellii]XP_060749747.1 neural cell adhesion molecule L1.1 isoform X1 [Tachysurus vachellii]
MSRAQSHSSATRGKCRASQLLFLLLWMGKTFGAIHIPIELKEPPLITLQTQSFTACYIDDISLMCEASGNPTPTFRWVKDGQLFNDEMDGTGILKGNESKELKFYHGKYRCYASNELGTAESGLINLVTETIPVVSVKEKKVEKTANKGESVVLQCNIPNSTVSSYVHWMDKKLMHVKQSERVIIGLNGNLYFANVEISDTRKDYTCFIQYIEARTILSSETVSLYVKSSNELVNRPPGLHQPQGTHSSYFALRGQNLILECIPYGLPTPTVKWQRKDASLSSSQATEQHFGRWLEFSSISESDDGEYTCTASNVIGHVTHSYTVNVEAAPYWRKQPKSARYTPGETVRLDCQAEGIPKPHITWKINGELLSETIPEPRRSVEGGTLILNNVNVADTAVYQCEASNKHGTALLNTYIHVIELPPQILTTDSRVYQATEGSTVYISCDTFGSPRPKVTWENNNFGPVLSNSRMSQLDNGTLHIMDVSHEDTGTYLCSVIATNLSITAHLDVLSKTRIVTPRHDHRTLRGTTLVWPCSYKVDPRLPLPLIQWRKDGKKIQPIAPDNKYIIHENGSLRINHIQAEDAGNYTCEIITTLDSDVITGSLTVIDKPEAPHSVKLDQKASRSVTVSWSPGHDNNSPVKEFVIEMQEDLHLEASSWKEAKRVPAEIHHLEISLLPFCSYQFRLAAVNEIGWSKFSHPSESYDTPPAEPEVAPGNVRSESTDPGSMIITWEELEPRHFNGPGFGYKVYWREADNSGNDWESQVVSHPPFVVNETNTFTPFEIKVQAVNNVGEGPSPEAVIGYSGEDVPLESPTHIEVTPVNATAVSVRWEPVNRTSVRGHLLGYRIYLRRLGSRRDHVHNRKEKRALATVREMVQAMESKEERQVIVVEGKEEATVRGLEFYSDYELSITAYNSKGEGPPSSPSYFKTSEGAPGPVSHLRFESPSNTELTLFWKKPHRTNGILRGYVLMYQEFVENGPSTLQKVELDDPTVTHYNVDKLDPKHFYIFSLNAFTDAGKGESVHINATTLLDGVPPSSINMTVGETAVNLSWVPGERQRNMGFAVRYHRGKSEPENGEWEESEQVNLTQGFYQLQGLNAGSFYFLEIRHDNITYWTQALQTKGPVIDGVHNSFATQGWFIGLISAVVLLLLLLLILCFVKRSKGGKYSVKEKEEGQIDSDAKPMKDEAFGEYRSLESSDSDEKRSFSQRSLCANLKRESEDSLGEYGDSVDIQFNEDGSFIGQYSGRRDTQPYAHGEHESSGVPSPTKPNPPPSNSFPTSITGTFGGN